MKIISITAGAAGMYCGSCSRDNALAVELIARGHDVTLVPLYTPTTTDEPNVSRDRVLFGGISIYLQQHLALFRRTPRFLDRLWDSPAVIGALASRSLSTDPRLLGELTVSMLEGERGVLRKEFDKFLDWMAEEPIPDLVNIPNSLLIGLAAPLRRVLKRPICCTLQGEDLFLDELVEPYRSQARNLIRQKVSDVDLFVAVSDFYVEPMAERLGISRDRIAVVPLGINLKGYERATPADGRPFKVGYFARVAPEKGLHVLAEAYRLFRARTGDASIRFAAAGYISRAHAPYLDDVRTQLTKAGLGDEFSYRGAVDRDGKLAFLKSIDVLSVPATYDEPKGVFLLEAMACGVPVVQPRRGAFTEIVTRTGGGLLVDADNSASLADGLHTLWADRATAARLGQCGYDGVRRHYSIAHAAERLLEAYRRVL